MNLKISVLGTEYEIRRVDYGEDEYVDKNQLDGYCAGTSREIVVLNLRTSSNWENASDSEIEEQEHETLRHEIIHAFLNESGLGWSSCASDHWAKNEEMVDWIAFQFPKLLKAFKEAGCIES